MFEQWEENEDMEIFESALDRWPYIEHDGARPQTYTGDKERRQP